MVLPDHFIALVNDIDKAAADYEALGFTILTRHDSNHTHSTAVYRFICLDDGSYILLTAFTDPEALTKHRLGPVLAYGEGWGDYSFTVDDVDALAKHLVAGGSKVAGPVDVGNTIADGSKWALKLLMGGRGTGGDDALPFVVEDVEGREYRIPAAVPHENGATGIARLVIASPIADETARMLGFIAGQAVKSDAIYDGKQAFEIDAGKYLISIFQDDPAAPLGRIGGGLYKIELRGGKAFDEFDLARTHGAKLSVVAA